MGFTGFYWVLLGFTEFYLVLLSFWLPIHLYISFRRTLDRNRVGFINFGTEPHSIRFKWVLLGFT